MQKPPHILNWLRLHFDELRKSEQKVAEAILRLPDDVIHMRIVDLSEEARVSEPSIVRFCRAIGFDSFQSLKVTLAQQMAANQSPVAYPISLNDSIQDLGNKVFQGVQSGLQQVFNQIDWTAVETAVDSIASCKRLFLFGYGASAAVACDVQHKLFRLKLSTQACSDPDTQMMISRLLNPDDAVIAISRTGRNTNLLDACHAIKESGAMLIGLSPGHSRLAKTAIVNIAIELDENTDVFTPMASRLAQLAVLDCIATALFLRLDEKHATKLAQAKAGLQKHKIN